MDVKLDPRVQVRARRRTVFRVDNNQYFLFIAVAVLAILVFLVLSVPGKPGVSNIQPNQQGNLSVQPVILPTAFQDQAEASTEPTTNTSNEEVVQKKVDLALFGGVGEVVNTIALTSADAESLVPEEVRTLLQAEDNDDLRSILSHAELVVIRPTSASLPNNNAPGEIVIVPPQTQCPTVAGNEVLIPMEAPLPAGVDYTSDVSGLSEKNEFMFRHAHISRLVVAMAQNTPDNPNGTQRFTFLSDVQLNHVIDSEVCWLNRQAEISVNAKLHRDALVAELRQWLKFSAIGPEKPFIARGLNGIGAE